VCRRIERDIRPVIGTVKLPDLMPRHLAGVLDRVLKRGSPVSANRVRETLRHFTGWCLGRGYIAADPAARLAKPFKEKPRDRALTDAELATIWKALEGVSDQARFSFKLLILTGRRVGEVIGLRWEEVDLNAGLWRLPSERSKNGRAWTFPLATSVVDLLRERHEAADRPATGYVLRGKRTRGREPKPTDAIVDRAKAHGLADAVATEWRIHDLRRTMRTGMARMGVLPHVAELCLGHTLKGITATYDVYNYESEMRAALELWARHVTTIGGERQCG
jgi:integrase